MKGFVAGLLVGLLLAASGTMRVAHADPQPALDRQLVERMTRALEDQVRATDKLVQATERAAEKCR